MGLLLTMLVYLEENVTSHIHLLIKALCACAAHDDMAYFTAQCSMLVARFVDIGVIMKLLLPRVLGDGTVSGAGAGASSGRWVFLVLTLPWSYV